MPRPDAHNSALSSRSRATRRRLRPPYQAVTLCQRELAMRSLNLARGLRLTVLVAPPGYGKTTLLAQWWHRLRARQIRAAWYSAANVDRDPSAFLKMLASALVDAGLGLGTDLERAIGDAGADITLDHLVFGLEQIETPAVLIIDEFERVDHPPIAALVRELIDVLPDGVHLALASRVKPSISLSLLRAQGGVRLIEANELRLGNEELAQVLERPPDSPEVAQVAEHTEGWPVAVQLYRLWRERAGKSGRVPRFTGRATEVADYLAEQVFSALPPSHQSLLMDLSISDYCEAALADCIRNTTNSAGLLEELSELLPELLQQSHAGDDIAYRLHPLVSEYAQGRLQQHPGRATVLHQRAAQWLWQHERYADALCHALDSRDDGTLQVMLRELPYFEIFLRFGAGELRTILREVPVEYRDQWPRLQMVSALAHFKAGFFGEAKTMLAGIREQTNGYRDAVNEAADRLECEGLALEVLFDGYIHGAAADCEPKMARIRALAPETPLMWAWCENVQLALELPRGALDAAQRALERTRDTFEASGIDQFGAQHLVVHELLLGLARGTLGAVAEQANAILRLPPGTQTGARVRNAMARIALAAVDHERQYHVRSADAMRLALDEFGDGEAWYEQYAIAAPVLVDGAYRRHGIDAALREIGAQRAHLKRLGMRCLDSLLDALEAGCHLRAGRTERAAQLAADAGLAAVAEPGKNFTPWRTRELASRILVQLELARGETARATELAQHMIEEGRAGGRSGTYIKGLVQLARARACGGAETAAREALSEAVRAAFPDGFLAPFAGEGEALLPLLQALAEAPQTSFEQGHVSAVLKALDSDRQFDDPNTLNEREAEIVAHLADGASNKLIARRLGITDNTIKYHLKKIYAKLGVSSRRAAAARVLQDRGSI
ncbi:LuxR C-terminal-related transcriptional regulator [Kineobactrum salinum]|uniref:AAA family ATPase n=1 Tax=Kineobactrum salinum TaxID=2708301 RepID=A0A6C0U0F0_9GAMM|nr:LuxR C-terminal-related transcriptional regulator [Kineobactrum salinum]QIB65388.1 AAA family ATPase [Kineobactrum salinum]